MSRHRVRAIVLTTALLAGLAGSTGSATAAMRGSDEAAFVTIQLPGQGSASNVITCTSRIGYPHNSSHVPGTVNTLATASCTAPVSYISVSVRLYYNGLLVSSGYNSGYSTPYKQANAATTCVPGNYRGEADVYYVSPPGYTPPSLYHQIGTPTILITCA